MSTQRSSLKPCSFVLFLLHPKYYKRGFDPYMLDPNCCHEIQCTFARGSLSNDDDDDDGETGISENEYNAWFRRSRQRYPEIYEFQEKHGTVNCCGCEGHVYHMYSFAAFEKEEGKALEFFAMEQRWSESERARVEAVHPYSRQACVVCRSKYESFAFLKEIPTRLVRLKRF